MLETLPARFSRLVLWTSAMGLGLASGLIGSIDAGWASPTQDATVGGAVFTGPTHAHPTSILINPAALGVGGRPSYTLYAAGSGQLDRYRIQRLRIVDPDEPAVSGPALNAHTMSPGGLLGGSLKAGDSAILAGAISLPTDEEYIAGKEDVGYHTLGGRQRQWAVTLATSVQLSRRLYVGAGLSWMSTSMHLSFLRDTALEDGTSGIESDCGGTPCGIENPQAAERWNVNVGTPDILGAQTVSIQAGIVYQFSQSWWFGLSYQSPPGLQAPLVLSGSVSVDRAPRDRTGVAGEDAFTANAEVIYKLPQMFVMGVRGPLSDKLELVAGLRWQNLSRQRVLDVRIFGRDVPDGTPEWYPRFRGFRDVIAVDAGVESGALGRWRLGGRLRVERGSTTKANISPMQIAGWNVTGVGGVEVQAGSGLSFALSVGVSFYPSQSVTDSAYDPIDRLDCVDNGFDIDDCIGSAEGRSIASANGDYARQSYNLRLSTRYNF